MHSQLVITVERLFIFMLCSMTPLYHVTEAKRCYCGITAESNDLLQCSLSHRTFADVGPGFRPIHCLKLDKVVKIGNFDDVKGIAPWGLSQLSPIDTLQLQLNIEKLTVPSLAGMNSLTDIVIKKVKEFAIDSCALAHLPSIDKVVFSCQRGLPQQITLRQTRRFTSFRLVNCMSQKFQFYCIRCAQNIDVYVIRIREGPAITKYMVSVKGEDCYTEWCSDEEMCMGNKELEGILQSMKSTAATIISTTATPLNTSIFNSNSTAQPSLSSPSPTNNVSVYDKDSQITNYSSSTIVAKVDEKYPDTTNNSTTIVPTPQHRQTSTSDSDNGTNNSNPVPSGSTNQSFILIDDKDYNHRKNAPKVTSRHEFTLLAIIVVCSLIAFVLFAGVLGFIISRSRKGSRLHYKVTENGNAKQLDELEEL